MRILWFTNDPMPAALRRAGRAVSGSGYWMACLLEHLRNCAGVEIDLVSACRGVSDDEFTEEGARYFTVGQPRFQPYFGFTRTDLEKCTAIVRERKPDLIHIHGTERFYGLLPARNLISTPCVISIQGLLGPYLPAFFGALSPAEVFRTDRLIELATRRGLLWRYRDFAEGARNEAEILAQGKAFMGRTCWDRAHVKGVNSKANYYHVGEVLRPGFARAQWSISQCERHTVIFTNAGEPRRGTEILLRAMQIVRGQFPDARLRLAGSAGTRSGYDRSLRRKIEESGLSSAVEFLGYLDGDAMVKELSRSHVFSISSYIENSPNSLCEAMQLGLPCVASYAGGIPSLVEQGRTGLLFPCGDAALLADAILSIFRDDALAKRLGREARIEASYRHAPGRVLSQLLAAYEDVATEGQHAHLCQAASHS